MLGIYLLRPQEDVVMQRAKVLERFYLHFEWRRSNVAAQCRFQVKHREFATRIE